MPTGNSQIIINYGAEPNDGQGDPLRTSFIKTDDNFSNIWAAGPVGSNITINNNTIAAINTNGNIFLAPQGVGVVESGRHFIPRVNNVWDLGSATNYWRNAYVSTLSVDSISVDGDLNIGGNLVVVGNIIEMGEIVTDALTIQLANTAISSAQANGAGITVGANDDIAFLLYDSINNTWITNIGVSINGNVGAINGSFSNTISANFLAGDGSSITNVNAVTLNGVSSSVSAVPNTIVLRDTNANISANYFLGNGSQLTGTYANANAVSYGESGWNGNIIPGINTTFTLGNATNHWQKIYTSSVTGTQISLTATANANTAWTFRNLTDSNGELYFPSGLAWESDRNTNADYIKSNAAGIIAFEAYHANTSISSAMHLEPFQAWIETTGPVLNRWTFDDAGNLTVPGNILPNTSNAYELGNSTNQWKSLYVSNNTIYINNVPIGLTLGNVLTVNGDAVLSDNSNTSVQTTGNISANYFFGNASQLIGTIANAAYAIDAGTAWAVSSANVSGLANVATSGEYGDLANVPTNLNQFTNGPGYITTATANVVSVNGKTGVVTVSEYSNAAVADYLNSGSFTGDISTTGNISGGNLYTTGILTSGPQNVTGNVNVAGNIIVTQGNLYYDQVYDLVIGDPLIYIGANNTGNVYDLGMVVSYNDGIYQHGGWVRDASDGIWKLFGNVVEEPTTVIDFTNAIYQPMQAGAITATSGSYSQALSVAGNITGNYILGNGSQLSGLSTVAFTGDYANLTGVPTNLNQFTNGPGYITTSTANVVSVNGQTGVVNLTIPTNTSNLINDSGYITTATANVISVNGLTGTVTVIEYSNAAVATYLASGTDAQNITTFGNISGSYLFGNISQTTGGYGNANVVANLAALSSNPVSTTGNITGGNLLTSGLVSATGVIRTADGMTATSNITGGNLLTSGIVSATSDVFAGSGQFRTTASTANIVNSTPTTVNIAGGANIAVNIGNAQGVVSLSGNVQGSTNGFAIGYRDIPQVSMIANATINITDAGKHYYSTSASNLVLTIANNSSQAFAIGSAINIINRGTGTMTIARGSGVSLYFAGNTTSADRTLSSYGAATIQKVESDTWFIVGVGLT